MSIYLAAADIGGTKTTVSVSGENGILAKTRSATRKEGADTAIPYQVIEMIETVCGEAGIDVEQINALGISTCSPFQKRESALGLVAPNLCGGIGWSPVPLPNDWEFIPLERELSRRFDRIEIGNDCITAAVAEHLFGAGRDEDNMVYVTWSTGIGAGAFVDGHLLGGKHRNAMHLGHIPLHLHGSDSYTEGWRKAANLEPFAAGPAIARHYDGSTETLKVFNEYRDGNERAKEIIEEAAKTFARALVSVTTLLDTRLFILGGSVSNDWDVLEPLVSKEFYAANPYFVEDVEFRRSALESYLGDMAGLSIVMPDEWIEKWRRERPWEKRPD